MKTSHIFSLAILPLPASLWSAAIQGTVTSSGVPLAGAKVVLIEGLVNGQRLDSTSTSASGAFSFSNVATGAKTVSASKPGYDPGNFLVAVSIDTATYRANLSLALNNSTSVIAGTVRRASDSSVLEGAAVTLSGGGLNGSRAAATDASGMYRFDSIPTGTGYNVSAAYPGLAGQSAGNVSASWNTATTVTTLYLGQNLGTVNGIVRRTDSTTVPIPGAKVVLLFQGAGVDSTTTDAAGTYSITANATTYTFQFSAPGYKDSLGNPTRQVTFPVTFGTTTTLSRNLTPATSQITGVVSRTTAPAGPLAGLKVVLGRRTSNTGTGATFVMLDSTTTNSAGQYLFTDLIAAGATVVGQAQSRYRVYVTDTTTPPTFINFPNGNTQNNADLLQVATGAVLNFNIVLTDCTPANPICIGDPVVFNSAAARGNIRFFNQGNRLFLGFEAIHAERTVSIFSPNGALWHQVRIPAGETRAEVPAAFEPAKGFLYLMK